MRPGQSRGEQQQTLCSRRCSGKDINHERHLDKSLPGFDMGEIRYPQGIRSLGAALPVDLIQRTGGVGIADGGFDGFTPHRTFQPKAFHQPFHGTASRSNAFSCWLAP